MVCKFEADGMEELNDHLSQDHDVFTDVVTGDAVVLPRELYNALIGQRPVSEAPIRQPVRADGGASE